MVGHDDPLQEAVAVTVEEKEGLLNGSGMFRDAKQARTVASVFIGRDLGAEFGCGRFHWGVLEGCFPGGDDTFREGVGEPEGDGLDFSRGVEVGEVTAGVPAF